jgi:transcriptional regulator GlxA family with amidase domain
MDPRIASVIKYMETTIDASPSVPRLAALIGLSPSRFAHLFRDETGIPPARYLHRLRMQRARVLLERTFLSVRDVMRQVGFRDPSHFARDFRRYHGVAPSVLPGRGSHPGPAPEALLDHLITADQGIANDTGNRPEPLPVIDPSKSRTQG